MPAIEAHRSIEAVWRVEQTRLIAGLARMVRDVGFAEDLAQDALVAALEKWPSSGVPDNPGAWLMATAKNRAIDLMRRGTNFERKQEELVREVGARMAMDAAQVAHGFSDDLLALIFTCCHPVLGTEARVALTLKLLGGLTTPEIARAFLVSEATMAQRIVRAKKALANAGVPFETPDGSELDERLPAVLEVIYLVFNEGYAATAGEDLIRPGLCEEALRLGRIVADLVPREPEAQGLISLLEIQASRSRARVGAGGEPVLLADQDRSRWDPLLIRRGLAALARAETLPAPVGPYGLQAAIAACHARAARVEETDWVRIAALYEALGVISPSPIVELNRAVAVGMAFGPEPALALLDTVAEDPVLARYHLLPSVRGDLLSKLGRRQEARGEFERAAELTGNERERELLRRRAAECG
ncbi:MAG: RNA polymerase sigma factor [Solirubrobacterales bacterium]